MKKQTGKARVYAMRTRFKRDIVCEFLPPAHRRRSNKIVIVAGGAPSYPGKSPLPEFLSKKGFWAFIPRYRGSWESGGSFLRVSPHRDLLDMIDGFPRGFKDLFSGDVYAIKRPEIYLIGASFGGPAVILAARDPRVRKAVALSPVTDWLADSKTEPLDEYEPMTRRLFGEGYRGATRDWNKLGTGKFYSPMHEARTIDGKKLLIIHPQDDTTVYVKTSKLFAERTGAKIIVPKHGGHLGTSSVMDPEVWKVTKRFLDR